MQSSVKVVFNEILSEMKKRFQRNLIVLANIMKTFTVISKTHTYCRTFSLLLSGGSGSKSSDRSSGAKMPFRRRKTSNQPAEKSSIRRNSYPAGRNSHSACEKLENLVCKVINFWPFFSPKG